MTSARRTLIIHHCVLALALGFYTPLIVWKFRSHRDVFGAWLGIAILSISVAHTVYLGRKYRRLRREDEHRRAQGNRGNPAFSSAAGFLTITSPANITTITVTAGTVNTYTFGAGPGVEPLPVRQDEVPILGRKQAVLVRDGDTFAFQPLNGGGFGLALDSYGVVARATCNRLSSHPAPAEGCTCGFYAAVPDLFGPMEGMGLVTLDVLLRGRVIVHERGYRAEQQQVLGVTVYEECSCGLPTLGLALLTPADRGLAPACLRCAHQRPGGHVSLDEVAERLGIPVRLGHIPNDNPRF